MALPLLGAVAPLFASDLSPFSLACYPCSVAPACCPDSPAVLKLEEGARAGRLAQFYLPVKDKDDKFLIVFAFIKLGLLEVTEGGMGLGFVPVWLDGGLTPVSYTHLTLPTNREV